MAPPNRCLPNTPRSVARERQADAYPVVMRRIDRLVMLLVLAVALSGCTAEDCNAVFMNSSFVAVFPVEIDARSVCANEQCYPMVD